MSAPRKKWKVAVSRPDRVVLKAGGERFALLPAPARPCRCHGGLPAPPPLDPAVASAVVDGDVLAPGEVLQLSERVFLRRNEDGTAQRYLVPPGQPGMSMAAADRSSEGCP